MLNDILAQKRIILASGSPRRQQFLRDLGLNFEIQLNAVDEIYPSNLRREEISNYLAELKAKAFNNSLKENDILITSDTIVWHDERALGKPKSRLEAINMLTKLSNSSHEVITSICLKTNKSSSVFYDSTKVYFKALTEEEIEYYVDTYSPYDKAGSYGIQEWIGFIGITKIEGNYNTVVGLPLNKLYEHLILLP